MNPESEIYGRPTAAELVAAVAEFLEGEVRATTSGAVNFHALVATNALRMVERQLLDDGAARADAAIWKLGYPDEADAGSGYPGRRAGRPRARTAGRTACRGRCPAGGLAPRICRG